MSYEHRLVEAANGREFYDKIGRDADAQIAALTEKLRAVEAERDASDRELDVFGSQIVDLQSQLSTLRADLARKDAALKDLAELSRYDPGYPYSYTAETACQIMNEMRYAARAALQPKEPPCQTA